jgi:hypothetical protein
MNAGPRRWVRDESGQAVVLIAIVFMALMFAVGLAIDSGQLYVSKRTQQEAADAAAFAGAIQLYLGGTAAQAIQAAIDDAALNGYVDGQQSTTVTVSSPPATGAFQGNLLSVEVVIVRQVKTTLVPAQELFNQVRARGVAQTAPFASPYAIVTLKSGSGPCITVSNTGGIVVPTSPAPIEGGKIMANCSGNAVDLSGTGGINDPLGVDSVGSVVPSTRVTGPVTTPAPKQRDPFSGFPKPPLGTLRGGPPGPFQVPASACDPLTPLQPGYYEGGIKNNQPASCTVYLGTGVFVLKGGGLNQDAQTGSVITNIPAGGAMIFNTHDNYPGVPGSCGPITAQQGGKIDITAMTVVQSAQYAGMAIYQDAACTNAISIQSNGALNVHGTLYAPKAQLSISSQSAGTIDAQIVVDTINLGSQGSLTVNYRPSLAAQTSLPSLVE